jgi:lipoprotein-anchoring transpeptidase ErfK/SrfK
VASPVRRTARLAALGATLALACAAPGVAGASALGGGETGAAAAAAGGPSGLSSGPDPFLLTPKLAHLARVVAPTRALARPGAGRTVMHVPTLAPWGGGQVQLLVLGSALHDGQRWLRVRLPERPNTMTGWIRAAVTVDSTTPWRILVSTAHERVVVTRGGRWVESFRAVVGKPSTPTPRGLFAVDERIRQPAGSELGPWALFLTAHSRVLRNYGGGPGRVAIHGRAGPLLAAPLGTAASHGCIRVDDRRVRWLDRIAVEGTPVLVRR